MAFYNNITRAFELGKLGWQLSKLRNSDTPSERYADVACTMASLRGLPQKFGQILSLKNLPEEDCPYTTLTDNGKCAPFQDYLAWLKSDLGEDRMGQFTSIHERGSAASIGQVHEATLRNGVRVAVKVQYPFIKDAIETDLQALGWLALPLAGKKNKFDLRAYKEALRNSLLREIDYLQEIEAMGRFRNFFSEDDRLQIPESIPELCSHNVITMTWLDGLRFEETTQLPIEHRKQVAVSLLDFFLQSWLILGEGHGDPHAGNFRFRHLPSGMQTGILDFGCTLTISEKQRQALYHLLHPDISLQPHSALGLFSDLGFAQEVLEPMVEKLPELISIFRAPFFQAGEFDVSEWHLSERISHLLKDDKWNFRYAGPASLLAFIRSFSGLVIYLSTLNAPISWGERLLAINSNRHTTVSLPSVRIPGKTETQVLFREEFDIARHLKVQVLEDNKTKVQIHLPAQAVYSLYEIIPPEILATILKQDTNLDEIMNEVHREGLHKRALFRCTSDKKKILIDLV